MTRVFSALILVMATTGLFSSPVRAGDVELLGAGATFPYPLYSKMFDVYYKGHAVRINYQAIGSGGGIRQLLSKTVDFGATDAFMSDEELGKADGEILHIPLCLGAVAVTYNLPGNPRLHFTPDLLADIFFGNVTRWNDPRVSTVNPSLELPDLKIAVCHRSDGSGTTFIFSDYLSKVSNEWKEKVGVGKSLNWPTGIGAKGNPGVAGLVKQIPGAIGYVELIYALQNDMPTGLLRNKSETFVEPAIESVSLAANVELPEDTRVSITDTDAKNGYPISSFTWLICYAEQSYDGRSEKRAREQITLLWWMIHEGQELAEPLHYAPLPKEAVKRAETILRSVTYGGSPILN